MFATSKTGPITFAHDYFTQRGGAERVAAAMIEAIKPDRVVTAMLRPSRTFKLPEGIIETTFLQRVAAFRNDPRRALPALPAAWRLIAPVREGVVICSSSGWSHSIRTGGTAHKVVYCHNPARWLYQASDYFKDQPIAVRAVMRLIRPLLLRWDLTAARSADLYIANSTAVAQRIRRVYGVEPVVLHPPITMDAQGVTSPVADMEPGFFVTVGRGRGYKNVDLLLEAFAELSSERLLVIGTAPVGVEIPPNVTFRLNLSDAELRWAYSHAIGLVSVSHEDFGLTPLEANAMGTPALVLRAGGFLDSLDEGVSGCFIDNSDRATIAEAVKDFPRVWDSDAIRRHAANFSMNAFLSRLDAVLARVASDEREVD